MQDFTTTEHPYRTAPPPRTHDPAATRIPYDGQTRIHLTIPSGLAHARIVIDPAARDLFAIDCGDGPWPQLRLIGDDLTVTWRRSFGDWLRDLVSPGHGDVAIVLHPAVAWTIALRGGLAGVELDLAAGKLARLDVAGGCSHVLIDLPAPAAFVPIRIFGGVSHLALRRPAATGVRLDVAGGLSRLELDDTSLDAIGGGAQLDTGDVSRDVPHYELSIAGGANELSIERDNAVGAP
jgi:hypothetical protein